MKCKWRVMISALGVIGLLTACGSGKTITLIDELPTVNFDVDSPVGQITKDVVVTQSFISNCNQIEAIQLYGATYIRENTATIQVRLMELSEVGQMSGEIIAEAVIDSFCMEDNQIIRIDLEEKEQAECIKQLSCNSDQNKNLKGKPCLIEITSPDGEPNQSPTFWMTQEDIYPDGALSVAGFEQYNDLWFQIEGK